MVKNRRLGDNSGCCNLSFLRYLVFIYSFIFYLAGAAVLLVGLWTVFFKSDYVALLADIQTNYNLSAYLLIFAGLFCILIGLVGCAGLTRDSRRCILIFAFSLSIIFLVEIAAGVLSYHFSDRLDSELKQKFQRVLQKSYGLDERVTKATDLLHSRYGCCGAVNFKDWRQSAWYNKTNVEKSLILPNVKNLTLEDQQFLQFDRILKVPHVCCITINRITCGERDHPSNIYTDGCYTVLKREVKEHAIILGATALGISAVQIFGIIVSCCLYSELKHVEPRDRRSNKKRNYVM